MRSAGPLLRFGYGANGATRGYKNTAAREAAYACRVAKLRWAHHRSDGALLD